MSHNLPPETLPEFLAMANEAWLRTLPEARKLDPFAFSTLRGTARQQVVDELLDKFPVNLDRAIDLALDCIPD